jgi:hypothetical protein
MKPTAHPEEVLLGEGGPTEAGWHSIEAFLRCPKEYQFRHIRKMSQPLAQTPDYFAFGILFHAGRARWFANKFDTSPKSWQSVVDAVQQETTASHLPISAKVTERVLFHLQEFMAYYSKRPRPTPVAAEYKLGPTPLIKGDSFFLWRTARLDDVSKYPEHGMKLCIGESKTTSTTLNDLFNQYELSGQTMLQALLWQNDPNGAAKYGPVEGILLDGVVKAYGKKDKPKFGRQFIPITKHQLDWFSLNLRGYLKAAASVDWNADAPRNVSACTRLIGRGRIACDYRDLCRYGKSAALKFVFEDGGSVSRWQPSEAEHVAPWK